MFNSNGFLPFALLLFTSIFLNHRAFDNFYILRSFNQLARFETHCFDAAENVLINSIA